MSSDKKLSTFERQVIEFKGTEMPFTGEYNSKTEPGIYCCKRCDAELFLSTDKFQSQCGWPSFDGEIKNAIKRISDADGHRTEIVCSKCDGHLGHVFNGEGHTPKNIRHCVNSISMTFKPTPEIKKEVALFASGCFWGTEYHFAKAKGVLETKVGFAGGSVKNPTYEQVCGGKTGHLECVQVTYNPAHTNFELMTKLFFETHDFSQTDGQGPDIGSQYLSSIFYADEFQKNTGNFVISELKAKGFAVATTLQPMAQFYPAEDYHQKYYFKNDKTPYCHIYRKIFHV